MTEQEWLTCADPVEMRGFLRPKASDRSIASDRKLRLYAVACCNRILHLMTDERSRNAVDVAERFADGKAKYGELDAAAVAAKAVSGPGASAARNVVRSSANVASWFTAFASRFDSEREAAGVPDQTEHEAQAELLRDIFGNPFHHIVVNQAWLTPAVVSQAQTIYEDRAFDRLLTLAVALEEAGCNNADILAHCRGIGPHVRGCWLVDLVLGKG